MEVMIDVIGQFYIIIILYGMETLGNRFKEKNISLKNIGIGQNENVKCWPCRKGQADKEEFCQSGII